MKMVKNCYKKRRKKNKHIKQINNDDYNINILERRPNSVLLNYIG
jgi:hypothetical protein